jgi:polar amino acid transport system substrate-binding protein
MIARLSLVVLVIAALVGCGGPVRSHAAAAKPAPTAAAKPAPTAPAAPAADVADEDDLLAAVLKAGKVRIGVKTDAPPFGYLLKGERVGFDIDLAHALARQLEIKDIEFVPVTSGDRSDKVVAGEVDMVIASMTMTRYREKRVDFSIPYFQDGQALLVKTGSPIQSYLDLAGKQVGVVKGSSSSYYMKQVCPDCTTLIVPGMEDLLKALADDKVEAISSDMLILMALRQQSGAADQYQIAGDRFTVEPYAIAIPENESKWRKAINHAIIALWESGEYQTIFNAWFGAGAPYETKTGFAIPVYPK